MQPRQMRDTFNPVFPRDTYSINVSFLDELFVAAEPRCNHMIFWITDDNRNGAADLVDRTPWEIFHSERRYSGRATGDSGWPLPFRPASILFRVDISPTSRIRGGKNYFRDVSR